MNQVNRFAAVFAGGVVAVMATGASASEVVGAAADNTVPVKVHVLLAGTAVVLAAQYAGRMTWRRWRSHKVAP